MTNEKKIDSKDNLIGIAVFLVLAFFLARSNFFSFENIGFFKSFFATNAVYQNGEHMRGPVGALAYVRSTLIILFLALMWQAYSAKKRTSTYLIFYAVVGFVVAKIGLDYFVFGKLMNARGGLSIVKIVIIAFMLLCVYGGLEKINFKVIK